MIFAKNTVLPIVFYIFMLIYPGLEVKAEHNEIAFKHLSTIDGLSNFTVLSIEQDRQGFMWFGTMDGLNRFDGKQIRTYRVDRTDPYSIGSNLIYSLLCTSDSGMWAGTSQGLYYYDYFHDNFHSIPIVDEEGNTMNDLEVKTMILDEASLWVGTSKGLFRYDLAAESFDLHLGEKNGKQIITETVEIIHKSDDGTIWMGGKQGLFYYKEGNISRIEDDPNSKYNQSTNVISIISDERGRIWFGTMDLNTGLLIYDTETGIFTDLNRVDGYVPHNKVNRLYRFEDGTIWAGTTWGLAIIDQNTFETTQLFYERRNPGSISHNSIRDIFQGENGIIWVGTYSGGVNYFNERSQLIKHETNIYDNKNSLNFNIVSSIFEAKNKDLWIGTEYGGVNIFNWQDKTYRVLRKEENANSLINDNIKSIVEDKKGRKFIATQFGLSIYDPSTNSFFNVDDTPGPRGRLNFKIVVGLCQDNLGNIWIGTTRWIGTSKVPGNGYLLMYDVEKDTIHHFYPDNLEQGIVRGGVNSMIYDSSRDIIWSGGDNGLTGFNLRTKTYLDENPFLQSAKKFQGIVINDLYLDKNNLLWIATFGHGLFIMDADSYRSRMVSTDEGLVEKSFYAITGDDSGNVWTSVSAHLLKIEAPNSINDSIAHIENYGIQEGFPAQQYFRKSVFTGVDGTLYFGGDDGFIAFNPQEVEKVVIYPSVAILDILSNGESLQQVSSKEGQYLNVGSLKSLQISHDQSSFAIQFIAPNFINPDNTWYQYQLSGIHDSWQELGNSNSINFTKLKAGNYELNIRASSDPDRFSSEFTSISLNVSPPYWGTPLANFGYFILILTLLYLLFVISRKWERLNQNLKFELLQREQEKEFNQKRIKFFTDISHELRTPLTLILAPLERIVKSNFGNLKIKNQLMLMLRNGDRMLQLINQLLDLRKLETGHVQLRVAKGNIVNFTKEASLSFRELAQDRNVEFKVVSTHNDINVWFDRDKFEIILFNLLSNAIKFTPERGKICVYIESEKIRSDSDLGKEKKMVRIRVVNSGLGIPEEQIEHIFERFYSGSNSIQQDKNSSGVGLEIVKNLVNLHKGTIAVESTYDENGITGSTCFSVELKGGKKHFTHEEIYAEYKSSEDISNYGKINLIQNADEMSKTDDDSSSRQEHIKDESILIIEDNNEVRKLVVSIFRERYNIFEASDGAEGLRIAQENIPELIISDIMMPVMDGIELCRKLKTNVITSHIPVILLTARTAVTFKYEGLETGADDYIVKPFSVEDLRLRSINIIKQRKALKERFSQAGLMHPSEISLTSVDEKMMQRTVNYISENIADNDLTIDKIAKEIGMSRTNFYRKVKAITNLSPAEFLRKIRMNHAAELLKTNKVRVSEVRFMVGISDVDYFRKCFKNQYKMTPKEYIDTHLN